MAAHYLSNYSYLDKFRWSKTKDIHIWGKLDNHNTVGCRVKAILEAQLIFWAESVFHTL